MANNIASYKIEWLLIEDLSCLKEYIAQWQKLIDKTHSNLFCSPGWIMTWINIYWQPHWQLKTIMGFQNNQLLAIAPLYIQKTNKFISTTTLLPLGQGEPEESEVLSEFQDIVLANTDELLYKEIAKQIQVIKFDQFSCHSLLPNSNWHKVLLYVKNTTLTKTGKRYLISDTIDYLPKLSKNTRSKWKRCQKKLQALKAKFIWVTEDEQEKYWEKLIFFHQKRWHKKGKQGAFFHPDFIKFNTDFRQHNKIKMSALLINQQPIAINYYLHDKDTLYFYQCGWHESEFAQLSPGFSLHIWSILNNSLKNYDFMSGDVNDSYKKCFACTKITDIYLVKTVQKNLKQIVTKFVTKLLHHS